MTLEEFKTFELPDSPGVYKFLDPDKNILYVGKATSLKERTKSYFSKDLITDRGQKIVEMVEKATGIEFIPVDSVLEALILEAKLIKQLKPYYNTREKDDRSYYHVIITEEAYPRVFVERERVLSTNGDLGYQIKHSFGPFPNGGSLKEALKIIRSIFPFRDKKSNDPRHERFYQSLMLSPDVSDSEAQQAYAKVIRNIVTLFKGKKGDLLKTLEKEMHQLAKDQKFEEAHMVKLKLFALTHIKDVSLIKQDISHYYDGLPDTRIEAYDIAHTFGKDMVGVMTVMKYGEMDKSSYRKFIIRTRFKADDPGALKEVLRRRFKHTGWELPMMIVMDGNDIQRNAAQEVLAEYNLNIPVVSVVKDEHHKPKDVMGDSELIKKYRTDILLVNSEAHRFGLTWHRQKRDKIRSQKLLK